MNVVLWIAQALLAAIFLFAGIVKLVMPMDELAKQMPPLSGLFLRFIAVCEVLGAIGVVLPALLRIWPDLTPFAAAGLVIIMIGATVLTIMMGQGLMALLPLVVGLLAVFVAYGRWKFVPLQDRPRSSSK